MDMFDTFITPRMKKFNEAVHAKGAKLVKHTDGMIMELLPKFIECGADGHQSIDPIAGMDLAIVKEKFGDKLTLWGNIDCANLMCFGTPDMVDAAVSQCMKAAAKGGGYIFGTCNSIVRDTKPENYLRMIKCAKKYGKYPIL